MSESRGIDLVFYYSKHNKQSFNALAGALEASAPPDLRLRFASDAGELAGAARALPAKGRPAVLAFSFFTSQKAELSALIKRLFRGKKTGITLIAGGPHPSGLPRETLDMGFDYVFTGEGEVSLPEFLRAVAAGAPPEAKIIKGKRPASLDAFAPVSVKWGRFGPIELTRGCPFGCAYCQTSFLFGPAPRHRSLENTLYYVRLMRREGLKYVRFITPDAFGYGSPDGKAMNLKAVKGLLEGAAAELKSGGSLFFGSFPSEVRPEHVTRETLELTRRFAVNKRLVIGAQSASPRLLKAIRRGHSPNDVYRAVELCAKYGFKADVDFIFGLPGETESDLEETFLFIREILPLGARIHAHAFMPLPGTPFKRKQPEPLTAKTENFIRSLVARGQAFGQWERQSTMPAISDRLCLPCSKNVK